MWKKTFAMGCFLWINKETDEYLRLVRRTNWDLLLNDKPIKSFENESEGIDYVNKNYEIENKGEGVVE